MNVGAFQSTLWMGNSASITASAPADDLVVHGGDSSAGTTTLGTLVVRGGRASGAELGMPGSVQVAGGDNTNAANVNPGGDVTIRAGDTAGAGAGGNLRLQPGGSSNPTPGNPGRLQVVQTFKAGGTVTANAVVCFVSDLTVADCPAGATSALGVTVNTGNPVEVQFGGLAEVAYDAVVSPVAGWYACTSGTVAGQVTAQATPCEPGRMVGTVAEGGSSVATGLIFVRH